MALTPAATAMTLPRALAGDRHVAEDVGFKPLAGRRTARMSDEPASARCSAEARLDVLGPGDVVAGVAVGGLDVQHVLRPTAA